MVGEAISFQVSFTDEADNVDHVEYRVNEEGVESIFYSVAPNESATHKTRVVGSGNVSAMLLTAEGNPINTDYSSCEAGFEIEMHRVYMQFIASPKPPPPPSNSRQKKPGTWVAMAIHTAG